VDAARARYLKRGEILRFTNACDPDFRRLVQAALATGARYSELARLRASDFNPDSGTVHVRKSKSRKERHIVLEDEGIALFKAFAAGKANNDLLLPKDDGTAWGNSHQDKRMRAASNRARLEPHATMHVMRHTWASHAVMNGVPLMVVARNLGHSDTRMVERHYGHLSSSYIKDTIRASAPKFGLSPDSTVVPLTSVR
jgi:integrase